MSGTKLANMPVGSVIKLNENGGLVEFYVAKHDYENGLNGDGRTLIARKTDYGHLKWGSKAVNAYAECYLDSWFNDTYLKLLDENIQDAIGKTTFYYTPGNGDNTVTTLTRAVFTLSLTELSASLQSSANVEGSVLPIASDLKILRKDNGNATTQYTRTPNIKSTKGVFYIDTDGTSITTTSLSNSMGIRPVFTLPATVIVLADGTVSTNTPPVITSESGESGVDLGTKSEAFSFGYTVSDEDGDALTVTEKLDGVVMKTRTGVASGTALTFECPSTAESFQKILNGAHTITIEVSDGKDTVSFTATFTKAVYSASITLTEPLAVDGDITLALMAVIGEIPAGATYKVEATNNAKDSSPVWQDVTSEVQNGSNIVFENNVAANGAAFNFRITVERGTSAGGYISGVSGAFQ